MNNIIVLKFWAEWCSPCTALKRVIDEVRDEFLPKGVQFQYVNIDTDPDTTTQYGVHSVPTVVIVRNGQEYGRFIGLQSKDVYRNAIKSSLK